MVFSGLIEDRLALHELVMIYGDAVTRKDSSEWGNTWSEDAIWSVPNFPGLEKVEGRNQIVKKMGRCNEKLQIHCIYCSTWIIRN